MKGWYGCGAAALRRCGAAALRRCGAAGLRRCGAAAGLKATALVPGLQRKAARHSFCAQAAFCVISHFALFKPVHCALWCRGGQRGRSIICANGVRSLQLLENQTSEAGRTHPPGNQWFQTAHMHFPRLRIRTSCWGCKSQRPGSAAEPAGSA